MAIGRARAAWWLWLICSGLPEPSIDAVVETAMRRGFHVLPGFRVPARLTEAVLERRTHDLHVVGELEYLLEIALPGHGEGSLDQAVPTLFYPGHGDFGPVLGQFDFVGPKAATAMVMRYSFSLFFSIL